MNSAMSSYWPPKVVVAPMFHAAGSMSVLQCIALGVPQVVVPAFDPNVCLDLIEGEGCTMTLAVPTMVAALIAYPDLALFLPGLLR